MNWNPSWLNYGTRLEKLNLHYMQYLRDLGRDDGLSIIVDWIESVPLSLIAIGWTHGIAILFLFAL